MNILFLHPNFPAQFWHLAKAFAEMGDKVVYLTMQTNGNHIQGVTTVLYKRSWKPAEKLHPFLQTTEEAVLDGAAVAGALIQLRDEHHFKPDIIVGHTGWGSTLYCKDVYPEVPLL